MSGFKMLLVVIGVRCKTKVSKGQAIFRLLAIFFLIFCSAVWVGCRTSAPLNLGGGVTCVKTVGFAGTSNNMTLTFEPAIGKQTGNQVVVWGYFCANSDCSTSTTDWAANTSYTKGSSPYGAANGASLIQPTANNPCGFAYVTTTSGTSSTFGNEPVWTTNASPCMAQVGGVRDNTVTWTPLYPKVENGRQVTISCFAASPNSPYPLQNDRTYLNYLYFCPSMTSDSSIQLKCSVENSCSYISIFTSVYTGLCGTAPCFDTDGSNNCSSCTSLSASTGRGVYTNDFVTSLSGTVKDENLTPSGGCAQIQQDPKYFPGNLVSAKVVSSAGIQSCGATWSPADNAGMMIANIKTANSAVARSSGNNR